MPTSEPSDPTRPGEDPPSLAQLLGVIPTRTHNPTVPAPAARPRTGRRLAPSPSPPAHCIAAQGDAMPPPDVTPMSPARGSECASTAADIPYPEQLLFSPEQAGLLLQVPGSWLRKQAAAGRISSVLLGRRLLFARVDLDALIEAHRRPAMASARRFRSGH